MTQRVALGLEYVGTGFNGWQIQTDLGDTVQGRVETALGQIANARLRVHCAGRTDAGVHARLQVVHFDTTTERPMLAWVRGTNTKLDRRIGVLWAHPVSDAFHARFSAVERSYEYLIADQRRRDAFLQDRACLVADALNVDAMHEAAQSLLGERDFSAFRAAACQSKTPFRNVKKVAVVRVADLISIQISANAFLMHMVRNIAGSLIAIGRGLESRLWIDELLAGRDRTRAAATAPASGLYLHRIDYPTEFGLPKFPFRSS